MAKKPAEAPKLTVTDVRVYPIKNPRGTLLASATVTLNGSLVLNDWKIQKSTKPDKKYWVTPANRSYEKDGATEYRDIYFYLDDATRDHVINAVIDAATKKFKEDKT